MKRHQQILAAVLVVQIVLTAVVFWPRSASSGEGKALFPDLKVDDIVSVTITDNAGERITMRKVDDAWVIPKADDYAVQESNITPLLDSLVEMDTGNLVARTEASRRQLQVSKDDFVERIAFETADGLRHGLYLGSAPRYSASHVRIDGEDEIYLTDAISRWKINPRPSSWVDTSYMSVAQDKVTEVLLENAQGVFTFVRDDAGKWTMEGLVEGEIVSSGKIETLVSSVSSVRLKRPLSKTEEAAYGMDDPAAVVTLRTTEGTYTLTVGAHDAEEMSYVVKASDSAYYVTVAEATIKRLVENSRDDFMELPTPTPQS